MSETTYAKTAKGQEEIKTRAGGLTLRMRQALIIVDGKRSIDELRSTLNADNADDMLTALAEQGYIESCPLPVKETPPAAAIPTPATAALSALEQEATRKQAEKLARKKELAMKKQEDMEVARSLMSRM
jgi:hypothetical protein